MAEAEEYCSTREAAQRLGVSLRTVQLWVENGALRAWKTPGGHRRLSVSGVQAMLDERCLAVNVKGGRSALVFSVLVVGKDVAIVNFCRDSLRDMGISFLIRHLSVFPEDGCGLDEMDVLVLVDEPLDGQGVLGLLQARQDGEGGGYVLISLGGGDVPDGLDGITVYPHPLPMRRFATQLRQVAKHKLEAGHNG